MEEVIYHAEHPLKKWVKIFWFESFFDMHTLELEINMISVTFPLLQKGSAA